MRFPLRRNHVDDRLAVLRLAVERDAPHVTENARLANTMNDDREAGKPATTLLTALPVLTFAEGRVTPGIAVAEPCATTPTARPIAPPPALPFALPLKGQFT
ncbi:MAG: hypothetical protein ABI305_14285, partial [Tepidiformaceae bacterium]